MKKLSKKTREKYSKVILATLNEEELTDFRQTFLELHPSDQRDIFTGLDKSERHTVYEFISPREMAYIFRGLELKEQIEYLDEMEKEYPTDMLNKMFTDDIVTFISKLDQDKSDFILQQLSEDKIENIKNLLSYKKESAGAVMTKELISISSKVTVFDVLNMLRDRASDAEIVYYVYVVDEYGRLVGVISLKTLILSKPEECIEDRMKKRLISVPDTMDQEEVGKIIRKYDLLAVPVVSDEDDLLGVVTFDDIMDVLEAETTEDFGEISATKGSTDVSVGSFAAAKKRSPWIIALMFFGLVTGSVIGKFEDTLESIVLLAVFIPMIMDSAGNVGTQSLAVSVRGLALGTVDPKGYVKMIRRELGAGFLIGLICMVVITILVAVFYDHLILGLIVGFSLLCTLSASAVVGSTVPLIINKLKFDPAIASGPFITTLNDIIGLLIYFSIATNLMHVLK